MESKRANHQRHKTEADELDYYQILEFPRGCLRKDIKRARDRLIKIHHPDKSSDKEKAENTTKKLM